MYTPDQIYRAYAQLRRGIRRRAIRYTLRRYIPVRLAVQRIGSVLKTLETALRRGARHAEQLVLDTAVQPHWDAVPNPVLHEYRRCAEQAHPAIEALNAAGHPQRHLRPRCHTVQLALPTFGLILADASKAAYLNSLPGSGGLSSHAPNGVLNPAHAIGATTKQAYLCGLLDIGDE